MARLSNIKLHQEKKQAIAPEERTITPLNARFTPTTAEEALDVRSTEAVDPKNQTIAPIAKPEYNDLTVGRDVAVDPTKVTIAPIEDYKFKTWEEAEKFGKISQKDWAASRVRDMVAAGQNPGEYHNMLALIGDSETPEEKRKRERREAVGEAINGLGNLIGNVANLYYAPRSGYSIDLNTMDDKRRERMERIQAKRDALDNQRQKMILNAKIDDIKAEREAKIAADKAKADALKTAEERAWKIKYDAYMKELDNAHKLGQIDAQTKAKLAEQAAKTKTDKELEDYRQKNREALAVGNHQRIMEREEARGGGSRATIRVKRKDGNGYDEYRKNDITNPINIATIYDALPDKYKNKDEDKTTLADMQMAIGKAINNGDIEEIAPDIKVDTKKGNGKNKASTASDYDEDYVPVEDYNPYYGFWK